MPNNASRQGAPQFELAFPGVTLSAYTREDNEGVTRHYIGGTASSTAQDLYGSIIKPEAQVKMLGKLTDLAARLADKQSGLTAFLNHEYKIPDDVLGAFTRASLTTRDEADEQFIDLDIECRLVDFTSNPRAEAAYKQVADGIRHGWSIGAYFTEIEWMTDDPKDPDFWNYYVLDVNLLEISLVGIPANQRAWVRDAESAKAYAVACAERITADSRSSAQRRQLVQRSIVEHRSPAGAERLALAEDFRERATQKHLDQENVKALLRAAEALEQRDDGGELSPDDGRDKIGLAISHAAKAVGHGLCVKSATHIARCIESLAGVIGGDGGSGGPEGETDPAAQYAAQVRKLEPKAGDLLILSVPADFDATQAARLKERWQSEISSDVRCLILPEGMTVEKLADEKCADLNTLDETRAAMTAELSTLEATTAEKRAALEALDVEITEKGEKAAQGTAQVNDIVARATEAATQAAELEAEILQARASLDAAKAELAAKNAAIKDATDAFAVLTSKIDAARNERLGRKSVTVNEILTASTVSEVKPEHYKMSHSEQSAALAKQANGRQEQPMGRDYAAGAR